ncbi:YbjQ family protein [Thermomonospora echinospora]|nr:YbjQ family protein [Thermomonospora echinospora]
MLIVTTDGLPGFEIRRVLGPVLGVAVHNDQGMVPGPSPSSGTFRRSTGEQPGLGLAPTRREAVQRLAEEAQRMGANAVVGMCFDNALVGGGRGGHEVCAYGTAVVAEPAHGQAQGQHQYAKTGPQGQPAPPPYVEPQPGRPPMVGRNLTIGLHGDNPR